MKNCFIVLLVTFFTLSSSAGLHVAYSGKIKSIKKSFVEIKTKKGLRKISTKYLTKKQMQKIRKHRRSGKKIEILVNAKKFLLTKNN